MGQDIREMFRNEDSGQAEKLREGHSKRFEARLDSKIPIGKAAVERFFVLKIAAVLVVALGIAFYFISSPLEPAGVPVADSPENEVPSGNFHFSEVSPQFKEIEDYYMASLNMELASLEVNDNNKILIDSFMEQLAGLDREYTRLNQEMKDSGLNEQTLEAMIANLQLRLELMSKLKNKLKELKQTKNNTYEDLQA